MRGTTIELNYFDYEVQQEGYPGWFTFGQKTVLPDAPDPTRPGYGQPYAGVDLTTQLGSARWLQDLGGSWHMVLGGLYQVVDRNINTPVNNLTSNAGDYTSSLANGFAPRFQITSNIGYLNGLVRTGSIDHDLTIGTTGYRAVTNSVVDARHAGERAARAPPTSTIRARSPSRRPDCPTSPASTIRTSATSRASTSATRSRSRRNGRRASR